MKTIHHIILVVLFIVGFMIYINGGIKPIVKNLFDFKELSDFEEIHNERDSINIILARQEIQISELKKELTKSLQSIKKTDEQITNEIPTFYNSRYILADTSNINGVIKHLRSAKPDARDEYIRDSLYNGLRD